MSSAACGALLFHDMILKVGMNFFIVELCGHRVMYFCLKNVETFKIGTVTSAIA